MRRGCRVIVPSVVTDVGVCRSYQPRHRPGLPRRRHIVTEL